MEKIVTVFLQLLKIPVSKKYVEKLIKSHPDYPSLLSISDIFQRLGINHRVTKIEISHLHELTFPYLIPLDNGADLIVIKNQSNLKEHQDQLKNWSGTVVLAEPSNTTLDHENTNLYLKETKMRQHGISIVLVFVCFLLFSVFKFLSLIDGVLLTLSLCGLVVGYLLFAKKLGINYATVDSFCNTGKNANCNAVLESEIKLFGINFSDAVFTYFIFQSITLSCSPLFSSLQPAVSSLAALNVLTMPVVLFSFYYQYAIAKVWCRLCLIVDAILILQLATLSYGLYTRTVTVGPVSLLVLITLLLVALVVLSVVLLVKVSVERYEKLGEHPGISNRLKHSTSVFTSFLMKQKKIDTQPFEKEMMVGAPNAPIKIIMATNLYCNPCKQKHELVDQLVAMYPDKVNVAIRFVKSGKEISSVGQLLGYWHQSALGKENESELTASIMHNWFKVWDLKKFEEKYLVEPNESNIQDLESRHYEWIEKEDIRQTPTFFVNGYKLPKEYLIEDLLAMTPAFADCIEKSIKAERAST